MRFTRLKENNLQVFPSPNYHTNLNFKSVKITCTVQIIKTNGLSSYKPCFWTEYTIKLCNATFPQICGSGLYRIQAMAAKTVLRKRKYDRLQRL